MFYLDLQFDAGSTILLPQEYEERAIFVVDGVPEVGGAILTAGSMTVFDAGDNVAVSARTKARAMFFGCEPMTDLATSIWNFVASSKERIEAGKKPIGEENLWSSAGRQTEFIPLPDIRAVLRKPTG